VQLLLPQSARRARRAVAAVAAISCRRLGLNASHLVPFQAQKSRHHNVLPASPMCLGFC
jgi:hypothetical protein